MPDTFVQLWFLIVRSLGRHLAFDRIYFLRCRDPRWARRLQGM